jgi:hypothetical protein
MCTLDPFISEVLKFYVAGSVVTKHFLCLCSAKVIMSVAETSTVTHCLDTVCHVQTVPCTKGETELYTRTVPDQLWSVGNVCQGKYHADSTICKYFNANCVVFFFPIFLFGKLPILSSNWSLNRSIICELRTKFCSCQEPRSSSRTAQEPR